MFEAPTSNPIRTGTGRSADKNLVMHLLMHDNFFPAVLSKFRALRVENGTDDPEVAT